jgi:tripartite-type tricarboxylate transporter receptor subunit TctC
MRTASRRLPLPCIAVLILAGSATDLLARRIALKMADTWGQQVVLDNRPGGGGTLASGIVAKATPDGHTLRSEMERFGRVIKAAGLTIAQ